MNLHNWFHSINLHSTLFNRYKFGINEYDCMLMPSANINSTRKHITLVNPLPNPAFIIINSSKQQLKFVKYQELSLSQPTHIYMNCAAIPRTPWNTRRYIIHRSSAPEFGASRNCAEVASWFDHGFLKASSVALLIAAHISLFICSYTVLRNWCPKEGTEQLRFWFSSRKPVF